MINWRRNASVSRYVYYASFSNGLEMFSSLDPEFGSHVFQIYARSERSAVIPLPFYNSSHQALFETDLVEFGSSIGYYLWKFYSSQGILYETARATGVIVLLGLGSLLWYKILKVYFQRPAEDDKVDRTPRGKKGILSLFWEEELEDGDGKTDPNTLEGKYFGPSSPDVSDNDTPYSYNADTAKTWEDSLSNKASFVDDVSIKETGDIKHSGIKRKLKKKSKKHNQNNINAFNDSSSDDADSFSPDYYVRLKRSTSVDIQMSKSLRTSPDGASLGWTCGDLDSIKNNYSRKSSESMNMSSAYVLSKFSREQSIDSFCSDFSLDLNSPCFDSSVVDNFHKLESEVSNVIQNVLTCCAELQTLQTSPEYNQVSTTEEILEISEPTAPSPVISIKYPLYHITPRKQSKNLKRDDLCESCNSSYYPSPKSQSSLNGDNISLPSLEWDNEGISEYPDCDNELDLAKKSFPEGEPSNANYLSNQFELDMDYSELLPVDTILHESNSREKQEESQLSKSSKAVTKNSFESKGGWSSEESGYLDDSFMVSSNETVFNPHSDKDPEKNFLIQENEFRAILSIGNSKDILQYGEDEWRGNTDKAALMRQGYALIPDSVNCLTIRVVRGDNYCGLRSVLHQIIGAGFLHVNANDISVKLLSKLKSEKWLSQWKFGHKIKPYPSDFVEGTLVCMREWLDMEKRFVQSSDKYKFAVKILNSNHEIYLLEALKLFMINSVIDLFEKIECNEEVPLFATLLFSRDSSSNPKDFMHNHLNPIGEYAGIEQIEMFLLSYSLQVAIRIVRVSKLGTPEYLSIMKGDESTFMPMVNVISEDDRHYNVIL